MELKSNSSSSLVRTPRSNPTSNRHPGHTRSPNPMFDHNTESLRDNLSNGSNNSSIFHLPQWELTEQDHGLEFQSAAPPLFWVQSPCILGFWWWTPFWPPQTFWPPLYLYLAPIYYTLQVFVQFGRPRVRPFLESACVDQTNRIELQKPQLVFVRLIPVQIASCFVLACSRFLAGTIDRVDHVLLVELRLRSSDLLVRSRENNTINIKSSYPSAHRKIGTLAPIKWYQISGCSVRHPFRFFYLESRKQPTRKSRLVPLPKPICAPLLLLVLGLLKF